MHRVWITGDEVDGEQGLRARCSCGWVSPFQVLDTSVRALIAAHLWLNR